MPAKITHIAYFFPPQQLSNAALANISPDITADEITKLSGVEYRHIAAPNVTPSDLAFKAAEQLFQQFDNGRPPINALLFCTEGLDYKAPATACLLHHRLQLETDCLALDIPGGCTGFINGLQVAQGLMNNNNINNILLLTAETPSKVIHDDDINLRMLFSDGACATLITQSDKPHIGQFCYGTDGSKAKALWIEHSATRDPATTEWLQYHQGMSQGLQCGQMHMQGEQLLYFALKRVPQLITETLAANQLTHDDIDYYIFHQASKIILRTLKRKCRLPDNKFIENLDRHGNTVSSTIPIALQEEIEANRIQPGDKILLVGFGIGLSWGATVITI